MNRSQVLIENLNIFLEFVQSEEYKNMVVLSREDNSIKNFISDVHLRHDTISFFQDIHPAHERAVDESQELAQIICDFLDYE